MRSYVFLFCINFCCCRANDFVSKKNQLWNIDSSAHKHNTLQSPIDEIRINHLLSIKSHFDSAVVCRRSFAARAFVYLYHAITDSFVLVRRRTQIDTVKIICHSIGVFLESTVNCHVALRRRSPLKCFSCFL